MADYEAPTPKVTTGPIRGSRKIHVGPLGVEDARDQPRAVVRRTPAQRL